MYTNTQTVTIKRSGGKDRFGDATAGAHDRPVDGCVVWPTSSTEQVGLQDTVTSDITVLMPPGTDVLATDQVVVAGVPYEVAARPEVFSSPFTTVDPGVVVPLKRITG